MVEIGPKAFIHLDRIKSNYEKIQKRIGDRIILSVVKANGYGHGAIEIAKVISHFKNSKFAVFSFDEAMQLRNSDISNDIIIFSKMQPEFIDQAFNNNIILNLSSIEDINILKDYKSETNNCPRYHIKFDTGMTRLGIDIEDSELLYKKIISDLAITLKEYTLISQLQMREIYLMLICNWKSLRVLLIWQRNIIFSINMFTVQTVELYLIFKNLILI